MRITVAMKTGEFFMDVGFRESILEIKTRIQRMTGIPIHSQTLTTVYGCDLADGFDVEDYPAITDGARLHLVVAVPGPRFTVTLKYPSGETPMEVDGAETVLSLKEKIHIMDGTPIRRMSLSFGGAEMADSATLSDCGVGGAKGFEIRVSVKTMNRSSSSGGEVQARTVEFVVQTSSVFHNARIPVEVPETATVDELSGMLIGMGLLPVDGYVFVHKQRLM
ncbi:hypothetical protein M569_12992, partial [Genlisea aurea]